MRIKAKNAILMMEHTIASLHNLDGNQEIEFSIGYSTGLMNVVEDPDDAILLNPLPWINEVPDSIEYCQPGDTVHFLYRKPEGPGKGWDRRDILSDIEDERRVGEVIKHDTSRRMTMVYDFTRGEYRWFKWDGVCGCYIIEFYRPIDYAV